MNRSLLSPRHWPSWIAIGLIRLIVVLPYPAVMATGRGIGKSIRLFARKRVRIAELNLHLCYPNLDATARTQLIRENFAAIGMGLMEVAMAWWWPRERLERLLVNVQGEEHLPAPGDTKGTIFLTAHFSSLELSGRFLNHRSPTHAMYRPNENPVIQAMFERHRNRHLLGIISRKDVRNMIRALRAGEGVWFAPDQNFGEKGSVFVDFLGIPAASNPATSRFAKMSAARVIPFVLFRVPRGYRLKIEPPLEGLPSDDLQADTQRINDVFARWTQEAPEQYNWIHRRFKERPDGGRSPYKKPRRRT